MVAILLFDVTAYDPATFVAKARSLLSSHNHRKATARRRGDRQRRLDVGGYASRGQVLAAITTRLFAVPSSAGARRLRGKRRDECDRPPRRAGALRMARPRRRRRAQADH